MLNITIVAVGKLKERFWEQACDEYLKRMKAYVRLTLRECADVDPATAGGKLLALEKEGRSILAALPDRARVVLLASEGRQYTSEEISSYLDKQALLGVNEIAFILGGSDGVSEGVRQRADDILSLGRITLPHNLARVVLFEQLYRACKISRGEPYHK